MLHELSCITTKKGIQPFCWGPSERNNQQYEKFNYENHVCLRQRSY
jgi:hypothetical protein